MNRREFLGETSKGLLTATFALSSLDPLGLAGNWLAKETRNEGVPARQGKTGVSSSVELRRLGRTGLMVSAIGFGAMRTNNPAVLHRALDLGINYIDTAHCYQGGNNEKLVGQVIENRRQDAFIATKVHISSQKEMIRSVESSLRSLRTDYLDIVQLHNLKKPEQVTNGEAMAALEQLRKAGKVRFVGVTTHENEATVLKSAARTGFYDVVLVKYNFRSSPAVREAIEIAEKAGLGIVAMKTQAGGYRSKEMGALSPHQAALKWVLGNKHVATTVPSMVTFAQVEENFKVMGTRLSWNDRKTLSLYARATDKVYCRLCGECRDTCPDMVAIPEVMRFLMYAEGYEDLPLGRSQYVSLAPDRRAAKCLQCKKCKARCVNGLNIAARMVRAHHLLTRGYS